MQSSKSDLKEPSSFRRKQNVRRARTCRVSSNLPWWMWINKSRNSTTWSEPTCVLQWSKTEHATVFSWMHFVLWSRRNTKWCTKLDTCKRPCRRSTMQQKIHQIYLSHPKNWYQILNHRSISSPIRPHIQHRSLRSTQSARGKIRCVPSVQLRVIAPIKTTTRYRWAFRKSKYRHWRTIPAASAASSVHHKQSQSSPSSYLIQSVSHQNQFPLDKSRQFLNVLTL